MYIYVYLDEVEDMIYSCTFVMTLYTMYAPIPSPTLCGSATLMEMVYWFSGSGGLQKKKQQNNFYALKTYYTFIKNTQEKLKKNKTRGPWATSLT